MSSRSHGATSFSPTLRELVLTLEVKEELNNAEQSKGDAGARSNRVEGRKGEILPSSVC